ncbi:MAG: hypothetical protein K0S30_1587 [Clostridia bacterium]|jgi:hypothetical protein|nr:hypothetical protein [Clostridia bacterium]
MNTIAKHKTFITTILLTSLIFSTSSLCASAPLITLQATQPTLIEHRQIVSQFIDQLKIIQTRTYGLIQLALESPIKDIASFKTGINSVNNTTAVLRRDILNYQSTLLDSSFQYRDVLLLLNALNYTKNALFELELLSVTTNNVERTELIQNLFQSRTEGINTLNILEDLISETYN